MKIQYLDNRYRNENDDSVFDVKIGNETIKGIKAIKLSARKCNRCDYYHKCNQERVFRRYDCLANVKNLQSIYKLITTIMVGIWAYYVFTHFELGFFYKLSLMALSLTVFDIVCTLVIEVCVPKIYNWFFYQKVKKQLKIKRKEKAKEEAKIKADEEAFLKKIPCYLDVKEARTIVQAFSEIAKKCDYGSSTSNINCCVQSCEIIIKILQKDYFYYYRVSDVFEYYLPRVCTAIEMYKKAVDANAKTEQQELLFAEFFENASAYLEKKKNEAIYYNNADEVELKSSTDNLIKSLQEETQE